MYRQAQCSSLHFIRMHTPFIKANLNLPVCSCSFNSILSSCMSNNFKRKLNYKIILIYDTRSEPNINIGSAI